jgi:hypothetical protein
MPDDGSEMNNMLRSSSSSSDEEVDEAPVLQWRREDVPEAATGDQDGAAGAAQDPQGLVINQ